MDYKILGSTMPVVEFTLEQGEKLCSQSGAMKWMTQGIDMNTGMAGGLAGAFKRKIAGESSFLNYFTSQQDGEKIAFGHTFPGHIIPVDVSKESVICQKRAFLCATEHVDLSIAFQRRLGAGFFGGEGFIMQKVSGSGLAFLEIDGECVEMQLEAGESLKVETGAVGMFQESVRFNIERVKGVTNMLFGGEGLFLTTLTGPGRVWLQTMPIQSMVGEMSSYLPKPSRK